MIRRLLVIEHEDDSGAGMLGDRAVERGFELTVKVPLEMDLPSTAEGFDAILSLGAVPSVNDADAEPWLTPHLALLRDADERGVPVLGVCFGAQALAAALGGSVYRLTEPEIGWYSIESKQPELVEEGPWLEWHYDAINPPVDAIVIATSACCVQAYTLGKHLAVQFHPEVTTDQVQQWCDSDAAGPAVAGTTEARIMADSKMQEAAARVRANRLFDHFMEHAGL